MLRTLLRSRVAEAIAAPHGVDRWLELANPLWSVHEPRAEIVSMRREARDTVTLGLRPNGEWRGFTAGQHVRFGVEVDGVRRTRCFSIASSEHRDRELQITVKAGPRSTVARHLRDVARPGDVLVLSQAEGEFTLPARRPGRLVLVSGGSGITPVLSMLRTLADEDHRGDVAFVHYTREPMFDVELAVLGRRFDVDVRDPRDGRFDLGHLPPWAAAAITADTGVTHDTRDPHDTRDTRDTGGTTRAAAADAAIETYVCGPGSLMDAVRAAHPVPERVRTERFTLARHEASPDDATGTLRFADAGLSADNSGEPILVQAEQAGLTPAHGCRMGVCMTCTSHVERGCVRDLRTGAVTTIDGDEGADVQVCVSVPVGDVTVHL